MFNWVFGLGFMVSVFSVAGGGGDVAAISMGVNLALFVLIGVYEMTKE